MTHYLGGLTAGSNYWVRVASENAGGVRSGWSAVGQGRPSNLATVEPVADSVTEGNAAQFRFSLSPSNVTRTITYSIAVSGDFGVSAATGRTITVSGSQVLSLDTTDDGAIEENGSITVTITGVDSGYATGTPGSATVAVQDAGLADPTATIAAGTSPVTEGANAVFTVTLNPAPSSSVTVNYGVTVSGNYGVSAATGQTVTVGTTGTGTITLATTGDAVDEANGSVTVTLATGTGYTVGTANSASVTVNDDDDPTATIAANSASITEGSNAVFTVTLSRAQTSNVSVKYNVTVGGDYGVSAATNQTVAISSGATTGTITLSTIGDAVDEANGSVTVTLATGTGYAVGTAGSASVTVNDDDEPTATSVDAIPATWDLVPQNLAGNQFRLLFVTSGTRNAASTDIGVYNTFVQNAANADGVDNILKGFSAEFKVVGCTDTVNATANTATTGTGVPIYWVDGAKVADNYADFYDNSWDSNAPRNEKGELISGDVKVWTGCESDGTRGLSTATPPNSRALGGTHAGTISVRSAHPKNNARTISGLDAIRTQSNRLYALSPVLTLVDIDYDSDDDGLIEVNSLAKLNAIRYDPDGDGAAESGDETAYATAFPTPAAGMGCPDTGCTGYELTANLNFDTNNSGGANDGDTYWNGGAGWEPIGDSPRFTATFEGNGHTIANLFISRSSTKRLGLFARLEDATVRNLTLTGASVTGDDRVGLLAGQSYGTTAISGVSVSGDVTAGDDIAGGLVGATSEDTTIEDSSASGSVTGNVSVGGLVGANAGAISRSSSSANVFGDGSGSASDNVGGLVGTTSGAITASFATGSVSPLSNADSVNFVGGLIGEVNGQVVITASYATGSVSGNQRVGGLIGGFTGGSGSVVAGYATGAVSGSEDVGGLIGSADVTDVVVTASYSTGAVTGTTNAGGLIGRARTIRQGTNTVIATTVTDSYWDTESSGQSTSAGGTGKTGAELRAPTGYTGIYANWNLDLDNADGDDNASTGTDDFWDFGANHNYPTLRNTGGNQKGPGPVGSLAAALNGDGNLAPDRWIDSHGDYATAI